jgi:histone deacetylase 6
MPSAHHATCSGSFYPGTGAVGEVGTGAGAGYTVNVPWPCGGMRNGDYLAAFNHVVLPIAYGGWLPGPNCHCSL